MSKRRSPQLPKSRDGVPPSQERNQRVQRLVSEGAALLTAKRVGEAALRLAEAWELDPHSAPAAINLGGAYILQGQHVKAVPVLEAASRLEPDNAMVWVNLAAAYLGKLPFAGREAQDKAITAFERALSLNPHAPHVHYNLGLIYLQRDDLQQAAAYFTYALENDPSDSDAHSWLNKIISGKTDEDKTPQG
jgi:protein O-GlcNAc transferase